MFFNRMQFSATDGVENLHVPAGTAEGDVAVIGTDVGGEDDIEFVANFDDAFSGLDVPDDHAARLAAASATA